MVKVLSTVKNAVTDKKGSFSLVDASAVAIANELLKAFIYPVADKYNPLGKNVVVNVGGKILGAGISQKYLPKKSNANSILATAMMIGAGSDLVAYAKAKVLGGAKPEATEGAGETFIGGNDSFGGSNKTNGSGELFI